MGKKKKKRIQIICTEDEMAGWHNQIDGHGFEWLLGVGDGQGGWRAAVHGVAKNRTRLSD